MGSLYNAKFTGTVMILWPVSRNKGMFSHAILRRPASCFGR
jgi:hypothetical protein